MKFNSEPGAWPDEKHLFNDDHQHRGPCMTSPHVLPVISSNFGYFGQIPCDFAKRFNHPHMTAPRFFGSYLSTFILILGPMLPSHAQFPSNTTPTYDEIISAYEAIAAGHEKTTKLMEFGQTDALVPLHVLVIDAHGEFTPSSANAHEQVVCLIINGIHPGEPAGINASITFAEERASNPNDNVVYVIVPVYNIGGALNRNSYSRYNQNGPEEYGFRGNAKNLDLNRDFIKCDSRNALSFTRLFQMWKPHVFLDTHTSNGADYQPTMTLLSTFPEKMVPMQASFLEREMVPALFEGMAKRGEPMLPYVHLSGKTPEDGLMAFTDYPRYGSGYAALFNTLSFLTEAHMLKPFDRRVEATLEFLHVLDAFVADRHKVIRELKTIADKQTASEREFDVLWQVSDEVDSLLFAGYEAVFDSTPSGLLLFHYDRGRPYEKNVPYRSHHVAYGRTKLPKYYVVPGAWREVIERLEANDIDMRVLEKDTIIQVMTDYVAHYETLDPPFEGHYLHHNTGTTQRRMDLTFHAGDRLIPTDQVGNRYLAYTLDSKSADSFFNWNFFDSILRKKEYVSPYLFEETANEILRRNRPLRDNFEALKGMDPEFAKDSWAQMNYILDNSTLAESEYMRIPVYRVE